MSWDKYVKKQDLYPAGVFTQSGKAHEGVSDNQTYFPLLIQYTDSKEKVIVSSPDHIEKGRGFWVLKTRYSGEES